MLTSVHLVARYRDDAGSQDRPLFGAIVVRDGQYKFVTYANKL